jgi:hypothetical protein
MIATARPRIQSRNGKRFTKSPYNNNLPAETNLETLLATLNPVLQPGEFVFSTAPRPVGDPVCLFREAEGVTLVLRRAEAEALAFPFTFPCRLITLTVNSSLEAVGLLARVAAALAARGIPVNAVSAYYHDHLFVPVDWAEEALSALRSLAAG